MTFSKLGLATLALCGAAMSAHATVWTLGDRNSTTDINDATSGGMTNWTIDGMDQIFQQWFWYRVGPAGPEQSIDTLNFGGAFASDTNPFVDNRADTLALMYVDPAGRFNIQPSWTLRGGAAGSNRSDVTEAIVINNTSNQPLPFHFFQYCDFDLGGSSGGDNVGIPGPLHNTAIQSDGGFAMSETVVTPQPSHYAVGPYPSILNLLQNGVADDLPDFAGPLFNVDGTWGFQWDFLIQPGSSVIISKDKGFVPAPGAMGLLGLGALAVARRRR